VANVLTAGINKVRQALLSFSQPVSDTPDTSPTPDRPTSPADKLREGMQKIREDLTTFGTGVGLAAGAATAATTLATFDDWFPVPAYWQSFFWVPFAFFLCAAVGSALLTRRYFAARRRILIDSDTSSTAGWRKGLTEPEQGLLQRPLDSFARGEGARGAHDIDLRIKRLGRVAARSKNWGNDAVAEAANAEAARLSEAMDLAMVEGAVSLLEYRSAQVYKGWVTAALGMLIAVGVAGMFFLADWSQGERDRLTTWADCQKETADNLQDIICSEFDPRRFARQTGAATPSPTPAPGTSTSSMSPDPGVVQRLHDCAAFAPSISPAPSLPPGLRNRALAQCAGIAAQGQGGTAATTAAGSGP
jgi:hypothetical protein